jgi:hypothetical protein
MVTNTKVSPHQRSAGDVDSPQQRADLSGDPRGLTALHEDDSCTYHRPG